MGDPLSKVENNVLSVRDIDTMLSSAPRSCDISEEFGYYNYHCSSMCLHIDRCIIDIDNSRILEDVYIPSEVISHIDE